MVQKNENMEEERFHMPAPDELTAFLIRELAWARKIGVSYDEGGSAKEVILYGSKREVGALLAAYRGGYYANNAKPQDTRLN